MSHQTEARNEIGDLAQQEARRMYRRVLGAWASDCLRLRSAGLDRPSRREGAPSGIGWGVSRVSAERAR